MPGVNGLADSDRLLRLLRRSSELLEELDQLERYAWRQGKPVAGKPGYYNWYDPDTGQNRQQKTEPGSRGKGGGAGAAPPASAPGAAPAPAGASPAGSSTPAPGTPATPATGKGKGKPPARAATPKPPPPPKPTVQDMKAHLGALDKGKIDASTVKGVVQNVLGMKYQDILALRKELGIPPKGVRKASEAAEQIGKWLEGQAAPAAPEAAPGAAPAPDPSEFNMDDDAPLDLGAPASAAAAGTPASMSTAVGGDPGAADAHVLEALKGSPVHDLADLRQRLADRLPGKEFDKAMLRLNEAGKIQLHEDALPESHSPERRKQLVEDENGGVFTSVSPTDDGRPTAAGTPAAAPAAAPASKSAPAPAPAPEAAKPAGPKVAGSDPAAPDRSGTGTAATTGAPIDRLKGLYGRATDPSLSYKEIDQVIDEIAGTHDAGALKALARSFGITAPLLSKNAAKQRIRDRIVERKDRHERSKAFSSGQGMAATDPDEANEPAPAPRSPRPRPAVAGTPAPMPAPATPLPPPAPTKPTPPLDAKTAAHVSKLQDLYGRALDPALTTGEIDKVVDEITADSDAKGLVAIARAFGVTDTIPSKTAARLKIRDRIITRKDRHDRGKAFSGGPQKDPSGPGVSKPGDATPPAGAPAAQPVSTGAASPPASPPDAAPQATPAAPLAPKSAEPAASPGAPPHTAESYASPFAGRSGPLNDETADAMLRAVDAAAADRKLGNEGLKQLAARLGYSVSGTRAEMLTQLKDAINRGAVSAAQVKAIGGSDTQETARPATPAPAAKQPDADTAAPEVPQDEREWLAEQQQAAQQAGAAEAAGREEDEMAQALSQDADRGLSQKDAQEAQRQQEEQARQEAEKKQQEEAERQKQIRQRGQARQALGRMLPEGEDRQRLEEALEKVPELAGFLVGVYQTGKHLDPQALSEFLQNSASAPSLRQKVLSDPRGQEAVQEANKEAQTHRATVKSLRPSDPQKFLETMGKVRVANEQRRKAGQPTIPEQHTATSSKEKMPYPPEKGEIVMVRDEKGKPILAARVGAVEDTPEGWKITYQWQAHAGDHPLPTSLRQAYEAGFQGKDLAGFGGLSEPEALRLHQLGQADRIHGRHHGSALGTSWKSSQERRQDWLDRHKRLAERTQEILEQSGGLSGLLRLLPKMGTSKPGTINPFAHTSRHLVNGLLELAQHEWHQRGRDTGAKPTRADLERLVRQVVHRHFPHNGYEPLAGIRKLAQSLRDAGFRATDVLGGTLAVLGKLDKASPAELLKQVSEGTTPNGRVLAGHALAERIDMDRAPPVLRQLAEYWGKSLNNVRRDATRGGLAGRHYLEKHPEIRDWLASELGLPVASLKPVTVRSKYGGHIEDPADNIMAPLMARAAAHASTASSSWSPDDQGHVNALHKDGAHPEALRPRDETPMSEEEAQERAEAFVTALHRTGTAGAGSRGPADPAVAAATLEGKQGKYSQNNRIQGRILANLLGELHEKGLVRLSSDHDANSHLHSLPYDELGQQLNRIEPVPASTPEEKEANDKKLQTAIRDFLRDSHKHAAAHNRKVKNGEMVMLLPGQAGTFHDVRSGEYGHQSGYYVKTPEGWESLTTGRTFDHDTMKEMLEGGSFGHPVAVPVTQEMKQKGASQVRSYARPDRPARYGLRPADWSQPLARYGWTFYEGPRGGTGSQNTKTGKVVYDDGKLARGSGRPPAKSKQPARSPQGGAAPAAAPGKQASSNQAKSKPGAQLSPEALQDRLEADHAGRALVAALREEARPLIEVEGKYLALVARTKALFQRMYDAPTEAEQDAAGQEYRALEGKRQRFHDDVAEARVAFRDRVHERLKARKPHAILTQGLESLQGRSQESMQEGLDFAQALTERLPGDTSLPPLDLHNEVGQDRRAFCLQARESGTGRPVIALDPNDNTLAAAHELGHYLENSLPGASAVMRAFLQARVGDEEPTPMNQLFPGAFGEEEMGRKDHFDRVLGPVQSWYAGLEWEGGETELLSQGLELLWLDPARLVYHDPEYAQVILGILSGRLRQ